LAHYDFFLFGYLKKNSMGRTSGPKTRWSVSWKRFNQDPHSNALTRLWQMDREITQVQCEWGGVPLCKYLWFDVLSLLVRKIGFIASTFGRSHTCASPVWWNWI
jgi:hypothetical protein